MRKQIQVLLLFFFTSTLGFSQNCFNLIADMSGIDNASYQTELEAAACELRNAFPEEFRNDFKVFDFGFYSMTEYMQGGFQAVCCRRHFRCVDFRAAGIFPLHL